MLQKIIFIASILVLVVFASTSADARPIEPRSLTWHIVSDGEMSKICRQHGVRANCGGMASWDKKYRMCIIWTRSPRDAEDVQRWQVLHHELTHCQDGHFHH